MFFLLKYEKNTISSVYPNIPKYINTDSSINVIIIPLIRFLLFLLYLIPQIIDINIPPISPPI